MDKGWLRRGASKWRALKGRAALSRRRWVTGELAAYRLGTLRGLFLAIARYCHSNRPLDGAYLEFGSHGATTMRMAYDCFHHLFDWTYIAFDSFAGMPEPVGIDRGGIIRAGMNATPEASFRRICRRHGIPDEVLVTVPGFYETSLGPATKARLDITRAAVVYVDCDLYASAAAALAFVASLVTPGTVIAFDDWNLFFGDPERGERRAWREFTAAHPELGFEELVRTSEARVFVCVRGPGSGAISELS